ncbi:hypothetical protein PK35_03620 [Tamlana nanhaiensis]|uniref:histidine kinase n=1 Tax=Neotamlana nanhaiensis TaxID=1382798 RepID=A0A0D7W3Z7_9FLAO|nr:ATP-binding protein [Tamlana nanhaiensis]KJD33845.1 hypothetical protein PK35_03620 [Tamlana nanhaiensis]
MKNHFLLFCFLFIAVKSFGQTAVKKNIALVEDFIKQGDSLKKTDKSEALKLFEKGLAIALDEGFNNQAAILYKKIGVIHHVKRAYNVAEYTYKKGIKIDSVTAITADLLYNISLLKSTFNQQDSVLHYLEKSLAVYQNFEIKEPALKAFLRAGIIYKDRQLYEEALEYSIKAYHGFKKNNDNQKLADVCTTIGNIQNQLKNYNQALQYHFEALEIHKKLKSNFGKVISYTNIGNVYSSLNIIDSTISNYEKALLLSKKSNKQYAILLHNLGVAYSDISDFNASKNYFLEAIKANTILKDTTSLLYNYNGVLGLYIDHLDVIESQKYLNLSSKLLPSVSDNKAIIQFYENQSEFYQKTNNYKKAFESQKKYITLYKDIFNSENTRITQSLQAQFEYEKKENEILRLKLKDTESQYLIKEKTKDIQNKNLILIILATIILLLFVIYFLFLQRQKTHLQKTKIEKLEAIYQGQESIKKRIARDLHDIITTNFDGLRLRVLALKRAENVSEKIDGITTDLKKMNQQIRTVSHRLNPLEMYIGKQKFTDVIKSRLSEFQLYGKVFVELENELPEFLNELSLTIQNNFYGILLEVLNNIEKHALATKVIIKNSVDDKQWLHFIFEDNGIGIVQNHKEGIGLMNIKQRVEILEGSCNIGKTDTGTQVHIYFPLNKHH